MSDKKKPRNPPAPLEGGRLRGLARLVARRRTTPADAFIVLIFTQQQAGNAKYREDYAYDAFHGVSPFIILRQG